MRATARLEGEEDKGEGEAAAMEGERSRRDETELVDER